MMNLFSPPSSDDLIRLLRAWRFWVLGGILGASIGAAIFYIAPPPYRARATVIVDFNLEQALPDDTDRQHFYYLERETRKLEEIAWSDEVLGNVASGSDSVAALRDGKLLLGQPAEGGWHFYADDANASRAERLASAWVEAFESAVRHKIDSGGLNPFIQVEVAQATGLPVERREPVSTYLLIGALSFPALAALLVLIFKRAR